MAVQNNRNNAKLAPQRGGKDVSQYLADLESLLKRNTGSNTFVGQDTSSNIPMYIPGKVVNPTGLGETPSTMMYGNGMQAPAPVTRRIEDVSVNTNQNTNQSNNGWQRQETDFNDPQQQQAYNNPAPVTTEDQERVYQQTNKAYGIMSMTDGGILYNDGLIRYDDGTVREYSDPQAQPIMSMVDGSTQYSDGSFRRPAQPQEQNVQSIDRPIAIMSLEGGRVLYNDGIVREYIAPTNQTEVNPQAVPTNDSGVVNFYDKFDQGYVFQPRSANDLTGQCAWFSQQITTLPDGSSWRIGNTIDQKRGYLQNYEAAGLAYRPGEEQAQVGQSIVFNEGTRWGHVATISEIFQGQDGKTYYRLTESNYAAPNTVTHDRVVSANDPKIEGIVKTQPREGYTTKNYTQAPPITGERSLAVQDNISQTGEQERQGQDAPEDYETQLPPVSDNQSGGSFNQSMSPYNAGQQPISQLLNSTQQPQQMPSPIREAFSNIVSAPQQALDAVQPMSPQRQEAGSQVNQLGNVFAQKGIGTQLGNSPEGFVGAGEAVAGDLPAAGRELSNTIERVNLTPRIDTGASELFRGDFQGAKTNFLDTAGRVGSRVSQLPGQLGREIVKPAFADDGSQKSMPQSISENLGGAARSAGEYLQEKGGEVKDVLSQAGQGVKSLGQAGISALENVFKPKEEVQKRAVGDVVGSTEETGQAGQFSSVMDTAQSMANIAKNDTRDPFFKYGGGDTYKNFLKPNAESLLGGALSLDLFNDDFFKDLGNISSVFGGSKDLGTATEKYVNYEKEKYKPMNTINYEEGYDRGEIDNYNKQVQEYNNSLNNYFNSIRSSVSGAQSIFTPGPVSSAKNIFASSVPNVSRANMSMVPVSMSSPSFSPVSVSRPSQNISRPNMSSVASFSAPQASAAPRQQSAPQVQGGMSKVGGGVSGGMSIAPKAAAPKQNSTPVKNYSPAPKAAPKPQNSTPVKNFSPAPKPAPKPQSSPAPKPQSKPSPNVFQRVVSTVKNIFRR